MRGGKTLAAVLSFTCPLSLGQAQQLSIAPVRSSAPAIVRPYLATTVAPVRLANSPRLKELVRAGTIYLTAQDAIALALENNIDLEVARYNPFIAEWNVTRSEAGGALPGVPNAASQAGAVAAGQGVAGSQAAAGISAPGSGTSRSQGTNATIQQVGPITQTLDTLVQESSTFSHTTSPLANAIISQTPVLIDSTRVYKFNVQQGTLTGGIVTLSYSDNYLNENAPTDVLNPSTATNLSISVQHNLLQGFGVAVNSRFITVAKMNVKTSDLTFQTQVINIVSQVLNDYYGLEAAYEDLKAKKNAADTAQSFLKNVKEQVRIGTLSPTDVLNAQSQAITTQQAVVDSDASLQQQETQLKNLLSRTGTADPVLRNARLVPVDPIVIPDHDDLPSLDEMVKQALANRTDLAGEQQNEKASEVSLLGTQNGVLPTLGFLAAESAAGLSGVGHTITIDGFSASALPYFEGGIGTSLGQVFRRDFPTDQGAGYFATSIHNRTAQADYAIDQLQYRQTQLGTRKDINQVQVDVLNYQIALRQARARYDAAVQNRILQEQLLSAEQKRFNLGASIPYNVVQQQRDLMTAQSTEVAARVAYSNARIALERTTGTLLAEYHVSMAEAIEGKVVRASVPPAAP